LKSHLLILFFEEKKVICEVDFIKQIQAARKKC